MAQAAGAILVSRPSKWGNPYVIGELFFPPSTGMPNGPDSPAAYPMIRVIDAWHAVDLYRALWRAWLRENYPARSFCLEALEQLRGKDLACWCPLDRPCHADVLLELANR